MKGDRIYMENKKKIILSIISLAAITTLLTGCTEKKEENNNNNNNNQAQEPVKEPEEKKLVCTLTEDEDEDVTEEIKYTINYKGDSYNKVIAVSTMIYKDGKYDEDTATELANDCNKDLIEAKGVSCNVQKSGARIYTTYTLTIADLDEAGKKVAEKMAVNEFDNKKYDDLKELLTSAGYKCQ